MTRSNAREIAVHLAFEFSFSNETADQLLGEEAPLYAEFPNEKQRGYIETLVRGVYLHCAELDEYISRYAIGWDFSRLPRVSIAIMRIAMYEILYMQDVPNAAAINEAVELAKHSFVRRESIPERTPVMAEGIFDAEPEQGEQ